MLHHALLWLAPACLGGGRNKRGVHLVSLYLRAATTVAYYLSAKGRHVEFNNRVADYGSCFILAKIEILFYIPYLTLNDWSRGEQ